MNEKSIILSKPQEEVLRSTKQRILALAGQAGGKSHIAGLISAELIINYPQARGFIGANTHNQLSKATLDRVFQVWGEMFNWKRDKQYTVNIAPPKEWIKYGQKLESYEKTICFDNGAVIFTASLENYMAIDGTEFTWGILDETKDTREEAVKEVITGRLRQKTLWAKDGLIYDKPIDGSVSWNPLYVLTSPAKVRWINEWFELDDKYEEISKKIFSKTDYYTLETKDKQVVIYSTYHNEKNLASGYIEQRLADLKGSPHLVDMLIYGSPIAKSGGEFFSQFRRLEHVQEFEMEDAPIHISLDFNLVPYITMTCWQIILKDEIYQVNCFDEICLKSPKNNTEDLCKEFEFRHLYNKKYPIFYYGDYSGRTGTTIVKDDIHNYTTLERCLSKYLNDNSNRATRKNPSITGSRDFCNKAFVEGLPIRIKIHPRCKNLIADLEFLKEGPDGKKLKEYAVDESGRRYEKLGHCGDSFIYFLISAFNSFYKSE